MENLTGLPPFAEDIQKLKAGNIFIFQIITAVGLVPSNFSDALFLR